MADDPDDTVPPAAAPVTISPGDRDIAIRTMIGEEPTAEGQAGVASSMLNRAASGNYGGSTLTAVASKPAAYESWTSNSKKLLAIPVTDPAYQKAAAIFDGVASGQIPDFTNGATHFYAPVAQAADGRAPPKWAAGQQPTPLGKSLFYAPDGPVSYQPPTPASQAITTATTPGAVPPDAASKYLAPPVAAPASVPPDAAAKYLTGTPSVATSVSPSGAPVPEDAAAKYLTVPAPAPAPVVAPQGAPGALAAAPDDGIAASLGKNIATGAIKGAADVPGFVGNLGNLADYVAARGAAAITGTPVEQQQAAIQAAKQPSTGDSFLHRLQNAIDPRNLFPSGSDISTPILAKTGEYVPSTAAGRTLQSGVEAAVGSFAPGARGAGAASAPANMLSGSTLVGAGAAGAIGQAATEATGDPLAGLGAAFIPGAITKAGGLVSNKLMGTVAPETANLAALARDKYGIPVNAGQLSDSPSVRFAASASNRMPFSGASNEAASQQTAFNRAVSNSFGQPSDKITPDVMAAAKDRIGNAFDDVASKTTIKVDPQFANDLTKTMSDAGSVLPDAEMKPLKSQIANLLSTIDPGTGQISGESYQALTRKGAPLDRAMNSGDPNVKYYAGQIRNALDDTMQRSAPPGVANQLSQARSQYKAMKTVEDLVEKSPTGDISPSLLMGATRKSYGNMAYGGGGDLGDLSRIGQKFLKEPPSSGTAERSNVINMLTQLGGIAAGAAGVGGAAASSLPLSGQIASAAAVPATFAINRLAGSYLRSPSVSNALINRSLGRAVAPGTSQKLNNLLVGPAIGQAGASVGVPSR